MSLPIAEMPVQDAAEAVELSVVVPVLDERENVATLVDLLAAALEGIVFEIVFVDDDSRDGTIDALRDLARRDRRVRLLHRIGRRGLSSAVVEGIQSTTAPFVAVIDGDMQHDETILPRMLAELRDDRADLVVGTRYAEGGSIGAWSERRKEASRIATWLAAFVVRAPLSDPMSGFFMIRRSTFDAAVRRLSSQGYKILLDIVASLETAPRIVEVPYRFRTREHGTSKLDAAVSWEYLVLLADKLVGSVVPVRFLLFVAVGGAGVFVHMFVLTILHFFTSLAFGIAQGIAMMVAMTFNFFVNNVLTYRDRRLRGSALIWGLISFYAVCSVGAAANVGIADFIFRRDYSWWLSGLAGILVGAVWNYAASSALTWKRR